MPEATLAIPAAALPFEVVPEASACEPLEFLTELINDGRAQPSPKPVPHSRK
jgi:hypothetical protein